MKQQKITIGIALILALAILSITNVMAVSFVAPANGATISQNFLINVTNATTPSLVNCTFTIGSASTANTSVSLGSAINNTATNVNMTYNSTSLEDSNDYILTASCRNSSNSVFTATATGLIINNTIPTAPSALTPTSITGAGTTTFSSTVVNSKTTSCTYIISRGGATASDTLNYQSGTATYSGSTCSFAKDFTNAINGNWDYIITASDGSDTASASSTAVVAIQTGGSVGGGGGAPLTSVTDIPQFSAVAPETTTTQKDNTKLYWIIGGLVLAYFLFKKK